MAPVFPFLSFFVRILVAPSSVFQKLLFWQGTSPQFGNGPDRSDGKKADKEGNFQDALGRLPSESSCQTKERSKIWCGDHWSIQPEIPWKSEHSWGKQCLVSILYQLKQNRLSKSCYKISPRCFIDFWSADLSPNDKSVTPSLAPLSAS